MKPKQSMAEFFARQDVKDLQQIQKTNKPGSEPHDTATKQIEKLATEIGAGRYVTGVVN